MENDKNKERLQQQMDFIVEIDKAKNVVRQTYLADGGRKENDAEHSDVYKRQAYRFSIRKKIPALLMIIRIMRR